MQPVWSAGGGEFGSGMIDPELLLLDLLLSEFDDELLLDETLLFDELELPLTVLEVLLLDELLLDELAFEVAEALETEDEDWLEALDDGMVFSQMFGISQFVVQSGRSGLCCCCPCSR